MFCIKKKKKSSQSNWGGVEDTREWVDGERA
jgi:hypothetical protein